MLVADNAGKLILAIILKGRLARKIRNPDHPAEPGFGPELSRRRHPVRAVEGAGHDLDPGAFDPPEAEWRAAVRAEVALGDGRGAESRGLSARPGEIALVDFGERSE